MSETYDGDPDNFPTSLTMPTDDDPPTEATFRPSLDGLADRTAALKDGDLTIGGEKTFEDGIIVQTSAAFETGIQFGIDEDSPEIFDDEAPTIRRLIGRWRLSGSIFARLYVRKTDGGASTIRGFDFVENAVWNAGTSKWDFDSTGSPARLYEILGQNSTLASEDTLSAMRRKHVALMAGNPSDLDFDAAADTITRNTGSWINDGFEVGDVITITGTSSNNGNHTVVTVATSVLTVGNGIVNENNVNGAGVTIRTAVWSDTGWDSMRLALCAANPPATSSNAKKNTLYSSAIKKAWGRVRMAGVSPPRTASLSATGLGLASAAVDGAEILVTLRNAMETDEYKVTVTMGLQVGVAPYIQSAPTTTTFRIGFFDTTDGSLIDASDLDEDTLVFFDVDGVQS